ncbi:MAG: ribosomal RNA small subunit methyltransferase A [Kiritimatiellae bacterium]|nr:ribosomal RNA small subunit methyltransferase A [Kiritimatiellia bacterium]
MNRTSPSEVKAWCIGRGFHPNKTLGQNFLIDRNILTTLVDAVGAGAGDRVLEVGPGLGVMTEALLQRGIHVTAIEKDPALAAWLRDSLLKEYPDTFTLLEGDALETDWPTLLAQDFKAFASNLPYSVGTRILMDLICQPNAPERLVTLVQQEVADRFAARPSTPERGTAAIWIQADYDVHIVRSVKPSCFWPPPEVTSAIVAMQRHTRSTLSQTEKATLRALSKHLFTQRRKQLGTVLRKSPAPFNQADPAKANVDPTRRAETLTLPEWETLVTTITP